MSLAAKLKAHKDEMETLRKKQIEENKVVINEMFAEFFAAHPGVTGVRFRGYVPSFNDGDPCEFTLNALEVRLVPLGEESTEGEREDGWLGTYTLDQKTSLPKDAEAIDGILSEMADTVQAVFGDNFQAIIPRDGDAQVEEFDCGY